MQLSGREGPKGLTTPSPTRLPQEIVWKCQCPFSGRRIFGRGPIESPFVVIGEGPGSNELIKGIPFIGESGELLSKYWEEFLSEEAGGWYVTNSMMCRKPAVKDPRKNDKFTREGAQACRGRLLAELALHPRKLIVALGNSALWAVTGNFNYKITQVRGQLIESSIASIGILPVVHPAAILRGTSNYRQFRDDLMYAQRIKAAALMEETSHEEDPVDAERHTVVQVIKTAVEPEKIIVHSDAQSALTALEGMARFGGMIAGDIETSALNRRTGRILTVGACINPREVHIIDDYALWDIYQKGASDKLCADGRWTWHNGKFDVGYLRQKGFINAKVHDDTMLMSYCLDESRGVHDLETVGNDVIGARDYKHMIKPFLKNKKSSYADIPRDVLHKYQAFDISNTWQIAQVLREKVRQDEGLEKLYTRLMIPGSELLIRVEARGFQVDPEYAQMVHAELTNRVEAASTELFQIAGEEFNPDSWQQLSRIMYDKLRIRPYKGRRSTDQATLEKIGSHPIVKGILAYRKARVARSTFVDAVLEQMQDDGRIHPTFLLHGTRTGRLASREPNLQNIPRDPFIRGMYVAAEGMDLMEFDEDQAELRSLAELSGDEFLCGIYNSEHASLHDEMSIFLFGEGFTSEQRMRAKAVNFGIPYGREAFSIAEEFTVPPQEAQQWIDGWFRRAPGAHKFIMRCRDAAVKGYTIRTCYGRAKRHHFSSYETVDAMQNEAANFPHQSIASDINLDTAIQTLNDVESLGAGTVNLVHDSNVIEAPEDPKIQAQLKEIMFEAYPRTARNMGLRRVPFIADMKKGKRWGSLKKEK